MAAQAVQKPAAQAPAPKTKEIAPIDEFRKNLSTMEGEFKKALPEQITAEKFARVLNTAVGINPGLLAASRQTLWSSCMKAAADGLLPDGREAALVIFGQEVVYMPMIAGILKKIRNSGELFSLTSQVVYKNDKFRVWTDDNGDHLEHEPVIFGDRGEKVGVYALAKTKDGAVYIESMSRDQVMAVKSKSKAQTSLLWTTFEEEGWRKAVTRRLSKRLPMSSDLEVVIQRDDELFDLDSKKEEPVAPKPTSSRLSKIVGGSAQPGGNDKTDAGQAEQSAPAHREAVDAEVVETSDEQIPI